MSSNGYWGLLGLDDVNFGGARIPLHRVLQGVLNGVLTVVHFTILATIPILLMMIFFTIVVIGADMIWIVLWLVL